VSEPPLELRPQWTGAAIALLTIGLLILIPSGLCTAVFGIGSLVDNSPPGDIFFSLLLVLVVGGIPIAIGTALVRAGLKARK
jgi:hypothetical protein